MRSEADSHFRAVCRALVSESIELSTFLEKTRRAKEDKEHNEELQELALQDWVRRTPALKWVLLVFLQKNLTKHNCSLHRSGAPMDPDDARAATGGEAEEDGLHKDADRVRVDAVRDADGRYPI